MARPGLLPGLKVPPAPMEPPLSVASLKAAIDPAVDFKMPEFRFRFRLVTKALIMSTVTIVVPSGFTCHLNCHLAPPTMNTPQTGKRRFIALALAVFALAFATLNSSATPPTGYTQVWADEFNGTALDTTHWTVDHLGPYRDAINDTASVSVGGGHLAITVFTDASDKDHTGSINMRYKYQPLYGYIEASISTTNTGGNWSAFWMWVDSYGGTGSAPYHPHTDGTEPDIMEHRALNGSQVDISGQIDSALHWDNYNADEKSATNGLRGAGLGTGYHTYGMLWTPTSQSFYIDGAYQFTINDDPQTDPPTKLGAGNPVPVPNGVKIRGI